MVDTTSPPTYEEALAGIKSTLRLPSYRHPRPRHHPYTRTIPSIYSALAMNRPSLEALVQPAHAPLSSMDLVEAVAARVQAALRLEHEEHAEQDAQRIRRLSTLILDFVIGVKQAMSIRGGHPATIVPPNTTLP